MTSYTISIAGFKIFLTSVDVPDFWLEPSFLPFVVEYDPVNYHVRVTIVKKLSGTVDLFDDKVFESRDETRSFFSVFQKDDIYKFIVYHPLEINKIQQTALLKNDLCEWEICLHNDLKDTNPFSYPMGSLILYYLTVKYDALMMHASGINDGQKGRLFAGFSGCGKSTMAEIWKQKGGEVLNDDRIMIRKENAGYFIYNTPMLYTEMPKKALLQSLYIIEHSEHNRIERIQGVKAVSQVMAFCIQHSYNGTYLEHHLKFISELCEEIPVYKLGFVPDDKVPDFIIAHGS